MWYVKIWEIIILDKISESIISGQQPDYKPQFLEKLYAFLIIRHIFFLKKRLPSKYKCISLY